MIKNRIAKKIALILAVVTAFACVSGGCSQRNRIKVPKGLNREEAALYTAVASVFESGGSTKAEYLTVNIEGWSFAQLPDAVKEYVDEYAKKSNAKLMQYSFDELVQNNLIARGEEGSYYDDQYAYAQGKGNLFTFSLEKGQNINSDELEISVKKYISDADQSGYDVLLKYEKDKWQFIKRTNAWFNDQFENDETMTSDGPIK